MTPALKNLIIERYTGWVETWGVSFCFAVTQSIEKAEHIVAEAIVALVATELEQEAEFGPELGDKNKKGPALPSSVNAVRFAGTLWEIANKDAFRGFGADAFFRMPAVARAIVVLKAKAQFSRNQIATALNIKLSQVDDHLENARLLFSDGRPWLTSSPGVQVTDERWEPECPQWSAADLRANETATTNLQDVFAHYVGNDLDTETGQKLHSHLLVCTTCRSSFAHFKKQYLDWAGSIPSIEPDNDMRAHLKKVTNMAFKVRRHGPPKLMPGVRRIWRDGQIKAVLMGAALMALLHMLMKK